jgi:UDP:flavonoid glycosyltransferase YjiC (YdhE family)
MKMVFTSPPSYGHLYPILPLAVACAEAGHDVTVATGAPFLDRLPVPTVASLPPDVLLGALRAHTLRRHPELPLSTLDGVLRFGGHMFGETLPRVVIPVLLDVFRAMRPDLVVYECNDIGAAVAANLAGVRAVPFGVGPHTSLFQHWHRIAVDDQRDRWAHEAPDLGAYPDGYLDPFPVGLYGPEPLPPNRLPVRTAAWSEPVPLPDLFATPGLRPRVYVTLGTMAFGAVEVLRQAVLEAAAHDVDVLVAVGPEGDPALLGDLPANVHPVRFVPQGIVLRQVDLVVHHGGAGTVLGALENGLPQLVLPQGADQPLNARIVERTGVGQALTNDERTPGTITDAVGALLADGPERIAAKRMAEEIAAMPALAAVAAALTT